MSYSISEIKADLEGAMHGTTVNKITNLYGLMNRAARTCIADVDFAETKRVVPLSQPFFSGIYDYLAPSDLKNERIIDIRKQARRTLSDGFGQTYAKEFDQTKASVQTGVEASIRWNGSVKTLRAAVPTSSALIVASADSTTGWSVGGTASGLVLDNLNYFEGTGSLLINLTTGTGYIENSTLSPVDISSVQNLGSLFNFFYLPASVLTSATIRFGSSDSDYWEVTATADHAENAFILGWNTAEFPWPATSTGSPDATAITYVRVSLVVSAAVNGVRVDSITAQNGTIYESEYYSKCLFRDGTTGAFKEKVTADSDILNLDTDSYEVFFACLGWFISQQLQGLDASMADGGHYQTLYERAIERYCGTHKGEVSLPSIPYYRAKRAGYTKYIGRKFVA